jgi:hypothetical protein
MLLHLSQYRDSDVHKGDYFDRLKVPPIDKVVETLQGDGEPRVGRGVSKQLLDILACEILCGSGGCLAA